MITYKDNQSFTKNTLLTDLDQTGIVLIKGVNPDSDQPLLRLGRMLGTTDVGIDAELLGPLIMHLRENSDKAQNNHLPSYFTSNFFPLHTDVSYVPHPPKFMLLHCIHPDPGGGGINLLADCDKALASLADNERNTIGLKLFNFLYPPNCSEGQSQAHAIFEDGLWRYKYSSMDFPEQASSVVENFNRILADVSISILLERGDLLVVDNHRIAHGRTAFNRVHSNQPGRHIKRLYATTRDMRNPAVGESVGEYRAY